MTEAMLALVVSSLIQVVGILTNSSLTKYRLEALEKKVDKISAQSERALLAEQSVKSAHHRIDEVMDLIKEAKP